MNGGGDGKRNRRKEEGVTIFVGAFDDEEETVVAVGETGSAGALPANDGLTATAGASSDDGATPAVGVDAVAAVAGGRWGVGTMLSLRHATWARAGAACLYSGGSIMRSDMMIGERWCDRRNESLEALCEI